MCIEAGGFLCIFLRCTGYECQPGLVATVFARPDSPIPFLPASSSLWPLPLWVYLFFGLLLLFFFGVSLSLSAPSQGISDGSLYPPARLLVFRGILVYFFSRFGLPCGCFGVSRFFSRGPVRYFYFSLLGLQMIDICLYKGETGVAANSRAVV